MTNAADRMVSRRQCLAALGAAGATVMSGPRAMAGAAQPCPRLHRGISIHHLMNWPEVDGQGSAFRYLWPPFAGPGYQISAAELLALRRTGFDFSASRSIPRSSSRRPTGNGPISSGMLKPW